MASFRVSMKVPELAAALKQIGAYDGKTAQKIEDAVSTATKNIAKGAKQRVPVLSGALKKSISSRFDKKTITGYVSAKEPYAHLVEFGHKGATVEPVDKEALTVNGAVVESAKVPNVGAKPYLRPAFEQEKPELIRNITQAVKKT